MKKLLFLLLLSLNLLPGMRSGGLTIESGFAAMGQSYENELPEVQICGRIDDNPLDINWQNCYETVQRCYFTVSCTTREDISQDWCQIITRLNQQCATKINVVDCNGVQGGFAYRDGCGQCVGGNTQRTSTCFNPDGGSGGGSGGGSDPTPDPDPDPTEQDKCADFIDIITKVCNTEGGYVNDPNDRGGPTNHGIAWATWQENAQKYLGVEPTLNNLINLTTEDAQEIYKGEYWDAVDADEIKDGDIRYALVDFYINSKANAVKTMQRTLNQLGASVTVDGAMGSQTLNAINQADPVKLYNTFNDNRLAFYNMLCTSPRIKAVDRIKNKTYINGWTNRVNNFVDKTEANKYNVNCK